LQRLHSTNMRKTVGMASLALLLASFLVAFVPLPRAAPAQSSMTLLIDGDVNRPLNLTYNELYSYPMVSEVAELRCVDGYPDVTYNWTGIPLFYLLTLAGIKPDAYKIETICSDGYTSDLFMEEALNTTTILALEANGTTLPQLAYGPEGPNRLVVPDKYGYKWASGIQEIKVVTTDYKGEYESGGYSDEADVPGLDTVPTLTPPLQGLDVSYGNQTFEVDAFTNASITVSSFNPYQKTMNLNVTVPAGTSGFADIILQQNFLGKPYNITLDGNPISALEGDTNTTSYLYLTFGEGSHTLSLSAAQFEQIPETFLYYPLLLVLALLLITTKSLTRRKTRVPKKPTTIPPSLPAQKGSAAPFPPPSRTNQV